MRIISRFAFRHLDDPPPFMKSVTLTFGALALAFICGAGGYFLGKNQSLRPQATEPQQAGASHPGNPSWTLKRNSSSALVPKELRARLDQEMNPLARFKLALKNLDAWVAKDPKDALNWLSSQQASERRDEVIRMALNQFADLDAKGAADWALKNLSGVDLNNSLIAIAENWAQESGGEAAAWFLALPATQERDGAVENIFFSWAANEPTAALEYLKTHADLGELSPTLRRAALAGWAKSDPQAAVAASLALSRTQNDPGQFANTLANWATMDLESSSQWLLANLPTGNERMVAAQELATIFAHQSPATGVAWLEKLEAGAERDAAASALASAWGRSGAAEAAKWASTQSTATLSSDAIAGIAHNFLMHDPAAFHAWCAALPAGAMKDQVNQIGTPGAAQEDN